MWTHELLNRNGQTLFVIYKDGLTVGSLQFQDEDKDITLWQKVVENLNNVTP